VLLWTGCGGGGSSGSTGSSGSSGAGTSATALVSSCEHHYEAGDFGDNKFTGDRPTNTSAWCGCVIQTLLKEGTPATKIENAMETDATDHGGLAPIMFGQVPCGGEDPTSVQPQP
jgi:hypothetical protein